MTDKWLDLEVPDGSLNREEFHRRLYSNSLVMFKALSEIDDLSGTFNTKDEYMKLRDSVFEKYGIPNPNYKDCPEEYKPDFIFNNEMYWNKVSGGEKE